MRGDVRGHRLGGEAMSDGVVDRETVAGHAKGVGVGLVANELRSQRGGAVVLADVSLAIEPGEVVAIVGGSGAGKTTLLEALSGVRPSDSGAVYFDGVPLYESLDDFRFLLGYVPQDDIIHAELPLERTLRYAAQLRLPPGTDVGTAVEEVMAALDLTSRASVRVGSLSGGQRKRASIAVELLTRPRAFFLDEPTSGLDPATSAELLRVLRRLSQSGSTVVFTTHSVHDLASCDRVVFLASGGRLAFAGTVDDALRHFEVDRVEDVYLRLVQSFDEQAGPPPPSLATAERNELPSSASRQPGGFAQWWTLTRRTAETLVRNRLTVAILLGSPAMVVAMFAVLFRPGAFDPGDPSPGTIVMIIFWVAFGTFFFGLTYGLLQICTERNILRREHLAGLGLGPYLLSKIAVLMPFLLIVNVSMLVVLRGLDRLPADGVATYGAITVTLALQAAAALALGLLASAAVANPSQATLALPMLCFPAVLFSGAIVPVHVMAAVGAAISTVVPVRWTFEAIGHDLEVRELLAAGGSPLGPPLLETYGDAGTLSTGTYWAILAAFTVVFLAAAWVVLSRSLRRNIRWV